MHEAVAKAKDVRPVVAGSMLPGQSVVGMDGKSVPLNTALAKGKHVLIVYRGGWCPYCTRHFAAIGQQAEFLSQHGWAISSLSPDSPASIQAMLKKHGKDDVQYFSDADADVIRALGLAFVLDEKTRTIYKQYNIDLEQASGFKHYILPVPTVLLVVDGEIRAVHADADYKRRLQPELLRAMVAAVDKSPASKK